MNIRDLIRELNKIKKHTPDIEVCFVNENDKIEPISKIGVGFYSEALPPTSELLLTHKEIASEEGMSKITLLG